jgi:hypothetical protein
VTAAIAKAFAEKEFEKFRVWAQNLSEDFDRLVAKTSDDLTNNHIQQKPTPPVSFRLRGLFSASLISCFAAVHGLPWDDQPRRKSHLEMALTFLALSDTFCAR